jgi:hypothetical protein
MISQFIDIKCDHIGCPLPPKRAPRVVVPSKTPFELGHRPLRMMTTLHYCELHQGELKLEDLLIPKIKRDFERAAKGRPLDFKVDFDHAAIEWVLVTTPEYREFLMKLGGGGILKQALAT